MFGAGGFVGAWSSAATALPCRSTFASWSGCPSPTKTTGKSTVDVTGAVTTTSRQRANGLLPNDISLPSEIRTRRIGQNWKYVPSSPAGSRPASRAAFAIHIDARSSSSVPASRPRIASLARKKMSRRRSSSRMASSAGGVEPVASDIGASRDAAAGDDAGDVAHPPIAASNATPQTLATLLPRAPLPFAPWLGLTMRLGRCRDDRLDAAANVEVTRHLHPAWPARCRQVVEDAVYCPLVEDPIVAVTPEIELETFELETQSIWYIVDEDRSEVRCAPLELSQLPGVAFNAPDWA